MSSFKCSKGFGKSADILGNVWKALEIFKSRRDISRNPSHGKVKMSCIWCRKSLQVCYNPSVDSQSLLCQLLTDISPTCSQHQPLSTISSEAKSFSITIISFVGHKREIFSLKTMAFCCRQNMYLGKKCGGRVEQDQKAWAWKVDSRLCLSHFGQ